jgi:hypothetical protein
MVMQLTERDLLRTDHAVGGWQITAIECQRGLARVDSHDPHLTEIVVADLPPGRASGRDCFTAVACTDDGEALVMSRQAPPALLVTRSGQWPVPGHGEGQELIRIDGDQRLLILSAAAFDALPESLGRTLHGPPSIVLDADPFTLLHSLFREIGAGSGAIIGRYPHAPGRQERP